jgi:hypothetical protein
VGATAQSGIATRKWFSYFQALMKKVTQDIGDPKDEGGK